MSATVSTVSTVSTVLWIALWTAVMLAGAVIAVVLVAVMEGGLVQ